MSPEEEHTLVEQAKTNHRAFDDLYDYYYPKIANYILHRVGDVHVTQDITSTTFLKMWRSLPDFTWRGLPFSAWVYRIANNEVNSYFRNKKRWTLSLEELFEESGFEPLGDCDIETTFIEIEEKIALHQDYLLVQLLVQKLPRRYQEVLVLRYFEKKSLQEVAEITGRNLNTTKSLVARGTRKLKTSFDTHKRKGMQPFSARRVIESVEKKHE